MSEASDNNVDFSGLILGFSSAALSYMGFDMQGSGNGPKNLTLARQNIEIIKLLEKKTKGNLSSQEDELIKSVLNDLMLKFGNC